MNDCASPFLQMSFETTSLFLTKAASEGKREKRREEEAMIALKWINIYLDSHYCRLYQDTSQIFLTYEYLTI
jgi:hypothetical protein